MRGGRRRVALFSASSMTLLVAGCPDAPGRSEPRAKAPPEIPDVSSLDRDGDRLDDALTGSSEREPGGDDEVAVEAVFGAPIGVPETEAFVRAGGSIRRVFRAISHGFTGRIRRSRLPEAARALGPGLVVLKKERPLVRHLDEATRTGRVRPIWANGFAGTTGIDGTGVNIAFVDSGLDGTHPDLAGRQVGWMDYTADARTQPADVGGHGTHVAGIALGSGASFGVGPGTLRYTDTGSLATVFASEYAPTPVHLPSAFTITSTATWEGAGSTALTFRSGTDGNLTFSTLKSTGTGVSPLSLSFSETGTANKFLTVLTQNAGSTLRGFAIATQVTNYPAVGDGFPALRGVAASAGWFGARVFADDGAASTQEIGAALDDILARAESLGLKVVNLSLGVGGSGDDPTLRAKVNTLVDNGIVVVCSAGNDGPSGATADPGRSAKAITVGATSDTNRVTIYSSAGFAGTGAPDTDDKPDVVAPGGSDYESMILSVDSNTADGESTTLADQQADDYTSIMGTSMAAPFVSGAAALVIDALGKSGSAWTYGSGSSPLLVKMLLLASATETNATREGGQGNDPTLGRSAAPSDRNEGYGIINPDAAALAVLVPWDGQAFTASTTGQATDRRAWGWHATVPADGSLDLDLEVGPDADFDLYVYGATPSAKGTPQMLGASDHAGAGASESLGVTTPGPVYVFVKRVSGSGSFTLRAGARCGDAGACDAGAADAASPPPSASSPSSSSPPLPSSPRIPSPAFGGSTATASPQPPAAPASPSSSPPTGSATDDGGGCAVSVGGRARPPTPLGALGGLLLGAVTLLRRRGSI